MTTAGRERRPVLHASHPESGKRSRCGARSPAGLAVTVSPARLKAQAEEGGWKVCERCLSILDGTRIFGKEPA